MRALTLYQPWAILIAELLKHFETRRWRPPEVQIGQRIAIHAGKVADAWFRKSPLVTRALGTETLPSGAIVALAVLVSVHRTPRAWAECPRPSERRRPRARTRWSSGTTPRAGGSGSWGISRSSLSPSRAPATGASGRCRTK